MNITATKWILTAGENAEFRRPASYGKEAIPESLRFFLKKKDR